MKMFLEIKDIIMSKLKQTSKRSEALNLIQQGAKQIVLALKKEIIEELLEAQIEESLGKKYAKKREATDTDLTCRSCGERKANQVRRNGHYPRDLKVAEGKISNLSVPMVECKKCFRKIQVKFKILDPKLRYWIDVDKKILELYMNGVSYRKIRQMIGKQMAQRMGILTGWKRIQQIGKKVRSNNLVRGKKQAPEIATFDEVAIKVNGEKSWGLIAKTIQNGIPHLEMLISPTKDEEAWREVLKSKHTLLAVVTDGDKALESAVSKYLPGTRVQRCIWHILQIIRRKLEAKVEDKKVLWDIIKKASDIMKSGDINLAFDKVKQLIADYGAVAYEISFDIAKGLENLRAKQKGCELEIPLTTSSLEREIKEFRRRYKTMDGFGSTEGANNFTALWVKQRNCDYEGLDWLEEIMQTVYN